MCKIILVLEKSREGSLWGGPGKETWAMVLWIRTEKQRELRGCRTWRGWGGLHSSQGTWGHQCCALSPQGMWGPVLCSVSQQNLGMKCQTCGSHGVAAEARCAPDSRRHYLRTTQQSVGPGGIPQGPFCWPQAPFPPIQGTMFF